MNIKNKQAFSKPFNLVFTKKYPDLFIGPGVYKDFENAQKAGPENWIKESNRIIDINRNKQFFTLKKYTAHDANKQKKYIEDIQYITQTTKVTEIEFETINSKTLVSEKTSGVKNIAYDINKFKIIDNLKIPKVIDKTVNDTDLKANNAILNLHKKLNDVYKIEQLLSTGQLGVKKDRIFVPTKWAITSVDDTISKELVNKLLDYKRIDKYELYTFEFFKNKFYIIYFPQAWGFEMIESTDNFANIDYEINNPRKTYASNVTGAYYAARLEVAKHLNNLKKQARVVIFRDISKGYISKGVWVIRESVKQALTKKPISFNNLKELEEHLNKINIRDTTSFWVNKSNLLKDIKFQKRLFDF